MKRSLKHIYAQIVDDAANRTILTVQRPDGGRGEEGGARGRGGKALAERAKEAGITRVVFDRAGYQYHGRVKAVADGAREGGLEF